MVRTGHEQRLADALCLEVNAAQQLGEELAVEIGEDDTERGGLSALECAGGSVGGKVEFTRDVEDTRAGVVPNGGARIEDSGDRGDRDVGQPRDILDGDRQAALLRTGRRETRRSDAGACCVMKTFTSARL